MSSLPGRQPRNAALADQRSITDDEQPRTAQQRGGRLCADSVPAGAPGAGLPLRPQRAGVNAKRWVPPDPEILRRVKAALARL
jgi:hypothetical protein